MRWLSQPLKCRLSASTKKAIFSSLVVVGASAAVGTAAYVMYKKSKAESTETPANDPTDICATGSGTIENAIPWASASNVKLEKELGRAIITIGPGVIKLTKGVLPMAALPACILPNNNFARTLTATEFSTDVPNAGSWTIRCYKSQIANGIASVRLYFSPNKPDGTPSTASFDKPPADGTITLNVAISMQILLQ